MLSRQRRYIRNNFAFYSNIRYKIISDCSASWLFWSWQNQAGSVDRRRRRLELCSDKRIRHLQQISRWIWTEREEIIWRGKRSPTLCIISWWSWGNSQFPSDFKWRRQWIIATGENRVPRTYSKCGKFHWQHIDCPGQQLAGKARWSHCEKSWSPSSPWTTSARRHGRDDKDLVKWFSIWTWNLGPFFEKLFKGTWKLQFQV